MIGKCSGCYWEGECPVSKYERCTHQWLWLEDELNDDYVESVIESRRQEYMKDFEVYARENDYFS